MNFCEEVLDFEFDVKRITDPDEKEIFFNPLGFVDNHANDFSLEQWRERIFRFSVVGFVSHLASPRWLASAIA